MSELQIPAASASAIGLFACMSRFEFALKEAGFVAGKEGERAAADWDGFGKWATQQGIFDQLCSIDLIRTIISEPPKKQLRRGNSVEWSASPPVRNLHELSIAIRQVRNNLFHGGKPGADPRDETLCKAAIAVILFLANLHADVRSAFLGQ